MKEVMRLFKITFSIKDYSKLEFYDSYYKRYWKMYSNSANRECNLLFIPQVGQCFTIDCKMFLNSFDPVKRIDVIKEKVESLKFIVTDVNVRLEENEDKITGVSYIECTLRYSDNINSLSIMQDILESNDEALSQILYIVSHVVSQKTEECRE